MRISGTMPDNILRYERSLRPTLPTNYARFTGLIGVVSGFRMTSPRLQARLVQSIDRTSDAAPASIRHMRVDHGRFHVFMPEEFLDGPDVVTVCKQMRRKGMTERVAGRMLGDARRGRGGFRRPPDQRLIKVVPSLVAGLGAPPAVLLRKPVLPPPLPRCPWVLPIEDAREIDSTAPIRHIARVEALYLLERINEEPLHPVTIGLLGSRAAVSGSQGFAPAVAQLGLLRLRLPRCGRSAGRTFGYAGWGDAHSVFSPVAGPGDVRIHGYWYLSGY